MTQSTPREARGDEGGSNGGSRSGGSSESSGSSGSSASTAEPARPRKRMSGTERRAQLLRIGRTLFSERGYEATSIEEIALRAQVSKPVVYEHFGGKEGLYAVVVDREMAALHSAITASLSTHKNLAPHSSRLRLERVTLALLTYVEERSEGFRILVRDSPVSAEEGTYSSLLNEAIGQVEYLLGADFGKRDLDPELAALYAQALVGVVSSSATWWLDVRSPSKEIMATHLVNLCWNGLAHLSAEPSLDPRTLEFGARGAGLAHTAEVAED